jgi:hypothetical protein
VSQPTPPTCHNCTATMVPSSFSARSEWACPSCAFMAPGGLGRQWSHTTGEPCACEVCAASERLSKANPTHVVRWKVLLALIDASIPQRH